jgi:hypothetical protein
MVAKLVSPLSLVGAVAAVRDADGGEGCVVAMGVGVACSVGSDVGNIYEKQKNDKRENILPTSIWGPIGKIKA